MPSQGNYCVVRIKGTKEVHQHFIENADLEKLYKEIEKQKKQEGNIYFALSSFEGYRRLSEDSMYVKTFFIDIDVGKEKNSYDTRDQAFTALASFIEAYKFPEPTIVDSGNGLHVYWILKEEIEAKVWRMYATTFKKMMQDHGLVIDPAVPSDSSRVLRVPYTTKYNKDGTTANTELITEIFTYELQDFVSCLGEVQINPDAFDLKKVKKGLDEDTLKLLGYDNYEYVFQEIAERSLNGNGCNQIKWMLENAASCPEPLWYAGISVAARCVDADTAIHLMSEDYPGYSPEETERKAQQSLNEAKWAHGCDKFEDANPGGCEGCPYKGQVKTKSPIGIGIRLRVAEPGSSPPTVPTESEPVESVEPESVQNEDDKTFPQKYVVFPEALFPFRRAISGGIYRQMPDKTAKDGTKIVQEDFQVYPYDLVPIKRMTSPFDGECLHMRHFTPKDGVQDLIIPMKMLGKTDAFKEFLYSNAVMITEIAFPHFKEYLMKWSSYLIKMQKVEEMRVQMGWTKNPEKGSFVIGELEITPRGRFTCPIASTTRNVAPLLKEHGDLEVWQKTVQQYMETDRYYMFAYGVLVGFASPLIALSNIPGCTISFNGDKGMGKTGTLYGGLSVFGDPEKQKIATQDGATQQALISRATTLNSLMLGLDEVTHWKDEIIGQVVYKLAMNEVSKIRLQSSYNQERKTHEGSKLITVMTSNRSVIDKIQSYNPDAGGEMRRLLEFEIINLNGGIKLSDSVGRSLIEPLRHHYGHAGPVYIEELYRLGLPYIANLIEKWKLRMESEFYDMTDYTYWNSVTACIFAAGEIANRMGLLNYDLEAMFKFFLKDMHRQHNYRKAANKDMADYVDDFLLANIQHSIAFNGDKCVLEPRAALKVRYEVDEGMVYVSSSELKKYLTERNMTNFEQFENKLTKSGLLIKRDKKRLGAGWKNGLGSANVWAYYFKKDAESFITETLGEDSSV